MSSKALWAGARGLLTMMAMQAPRRRKRELCIRHGRRNDAIGLSANYLFIDIDKLSGASAPFANVGQDIQAIGFRTQVAF